MKVEFFRNLPLSLSMISAFAIAATEVPAWAILTSLLLIVWRFLYERIDIPKISTKLTPFIGLLFFAVVFIQHKTIFGQEESITILMGLMAIAILNFETERDLLFLVLLGFLMLVLKSVFSIDFIWLIPALFSFFGLWVALLTNNKVRRYRYVLKTALSSIPVFLALFIAFPRIVLFQMTKNISPAARSGFNEEVRPGRFTNTALSNEMVFRAQFANSDGIDADELYWRGSVLNKSNGFNWSKGRNEKRSGAPSIDNGPSLKYQIFLEPQAVNNLFVLEQAAKIVRSTEPFVEGNNSVFTLLNTSAKMIQFEGEARMKPNSIRHEGASSDETYLKIALLPPRSKKWVAEIIEKYSSPESRLNALNHFFADPGFRYTLTPDYYDNDLDEFLFVKKTGYCEHFAAAYATLARALGIPARIIIGYQGGTYNEIGDFWKISQRDAHAWVEIGLNGLWNRIDPTGFVAPLRLTLGSGDYFILSEAEQTEFSREKTWKDFSSLRLLYLKAITLVDSVNFSWTMLLLNYDLQAQLELLRSIDFSGFLLVAVAAIFGFFLYSKRRPKAKPSHQLQELFSEIENWAQKNQLTYPAESTPLQVLEVIYQKVPEVRNFISEFRTAYVGLVYQEKNLSTDYRKLQRKWKSLGLRKTSIVSN